MDSKAEVDLSKNEKPHRSKAAIAAFILGLLSICLFPLTYGITVLFSILALVKIKRSDGKLKGKWLAISGLVIPVVIITLLTIVWYQDAGPVPNEFTEADFNQVRPENEISYSILCQLNDKDNNPKGSPSIALNKKDLKLLEKIWDGINDIEIIELRLAYVRKHSDDILYLWEKSVKGRSIFEKLNEYSEIADLTDIFTSIDDTVPYSYNLKRLFEINLLHSHLLLDSRDDIQACKGLIEFDTVIRKHIVFARSLISKLVSYGCISMNLELANTIVNDPTVSSASLSLLESHFRPLNNEQMSMRNCFIHEYLYFKNSMPEELGIKSIPFFYKPNSINRYFHSVCQNWILMDKGEVVDAYCPISVWPWNKPVYPKVPLVEERILDKIYYDGYWWYNPIGSIQMKVLMPAIGKIFQIKEQIFIKDELFQWVLARRLGREGYLKARAYSDEYTVDVEKGLVFSVGPDGVAYTDDDIKMRINPEVLGLK